MRRTPKPLSFIYLASFLPLLLAGTVLAQQTFTNTNNTFRDPGPRQGPIGAGQPLTGLAGADLAAFLEGKETFNEVDGVSEGLGPRFNADSCAACHAQPDVGGSSPSINPQIAVASRNGARNLIPSFITQSGPVREVRLRRNPDGSAAGGVIDLFTISGRTDAPGCNASQPNFDQLLRNNNLSFRIPTPVFGGGLIESIPDSVLLANLAANSQAKANNGIKGRFNTNGNDGSITRFGWKAQNKSLLIFAGEAYNVEQGVSNEVFPQERDNIPGCMYNGTPEDFTHPEAGTVLASYSDSIHFANFMRDLAAPTPAPATDSTTRGAQLFVQIGCALCHTPSLTTGPSSHPQLSNKPVPLYSDLAIHHMGSILDDGVSQGLAGTDEFRTAPLWGLGQRLFFMHDGRASNLIDAVAAHVGQGSEANQSVINANNLQPSQKQDILNFLRSL